MWPYRDIWGDEEERCRVRDYLKMEWEYHTSIWVVQTNLENVRQEKDEMLNVSSSPSTFSYIDSMYVQWWWINRYGQDSPLDTSNMYFGYWL